MHNILARNLKAPPQTEGQREIEREREERETEAAVSEDEDNVSKPYREEGELEIRVCVSRLESIKEKNNNKK